MSEQETNLPVTEGHHHHVRIHIDRTPYESSTPTSGAALYVLANVQSNHALYREVEGDHEDKIVPRGEEYIHLHQDEHFYTAFLDIKIIVNAEQKTEHQHSLTFQDVVLLAFNPPPSGPNILVKVKYENGPHVNPEGSLQPGHSVQIRNGMRFHVTQTDKS